MINLGYKVATVTLALAVCKLLGKSSIEVGQANVQAKAVDSRDNRFFGGSTVTLRGPRNFR